MKVVTFFFLATVPVTTLVSAWHLQIYSGTNFIDVIEDRKGTLDQPCKTLSQGGVASSMHWVPTALVSGVKLYDQAKCQGGMILDADYEEHIEDFTRVLDSAGRRIDNRAKSYKIY